MSERSYNYVTLAVIFRPIYSLKSCILPAPTSCINCISSSTNTHTHTHTHSTMPELETVSPSSSHHFNGQSDKRRPVSRSMFALKTFVAGGVAGMCAKSSTAPLDRLKILLQAQNKYYKNYGVFSGFLAIYKQEGILGYYKGNGAMMVRIFPYAAIQFAAYEQYKKLLKPYFNQKTHTSKLVSGSLTGMTAVLFTYPLDMVRARLAYQVHQKKYNGIWNTLTLIPKQEGGLKALYRGFSSTIIGMIPYAGTAFYTYEVLKSFALDNPLLQPYTSKESFDGSGTMVLNIPTNLCVGGLAGACSQSVAYPFDVARRRMQLEGMISETPVYRSVSATLSHVYTTLGVRRGLFRGISINFYRAVPQVAVSFSTYEFLKQFLGISRPIS